MPELLYARTVQYHFDHDSVIMAFVFNVTDEYTVPLKSAAVDTLRLYPPTPDNVSVDPCHTNVNVIWLVVKPLKGEASTGTVGARVSTTTLHVDAHAE